MARRKKAKSERKDAKPVRKREIEKIAKIDKKKEIDVKREMEKRSKGIPLMYAAIIFIIIAIIGAVLIFSVPEKPLVKKGDLVLVQYTGELNDGTVFDSGNFTFNAGLGQASGFDEAVIGMHEGEVKRIELTPDQAYGEYDPNLIMDIPLIQEFNTTVNTTLELFNLTFGEPPVINNTYRLEGMQWDIRVVGIKNSNVTLRQEVEEGQLIHMDYGISVVTITGDKMTITLTPIIGSVVSTLVGDGRIISENGTHMMLDFNHELAGKNVTFTIKVLNILSD
jgi:FKBP-type peptidyl-prolyl cis-trans isomerase 2